MPPGVYLKCKNAKFSRVPPRTSSFARRINRTLHALFLRKENDRTLYKSLFELGYAHSVEVWFNSKLVGGLYGLAIGGAFFGESMFSRERDASKVALCHLVARLNKGNFKLLDTQFLTDHLVQFGCYEVTRDSYKSLLSKAISTKAIFHSNLVLEEFELFVQSTTQTS